MGSRELKEIDHFKYAASMLRWLLQKGKQDDNCHGQISIDQQNIILDKQAKHWTQE